MFTIEENDWAKNNGWSNYATWQLGEYMSTLMLPNRILYWHLVLEQSLKVSVGALEDSVFEKLSYKWAEIFYLLLYWDEEGDQTMLEQVISYETFDFSNSIFYISDVDERLLPLLLPYSAVSRRSRLTDSLGFLAFTDSTKTLVELPPLHALETKAVRSTFYLKQFIADAIELLDFVKNDLPELLDFSRKPVPQVFQEALSDIPALDTFPDRLVYTHLRALVRIFKPHEQPPEDIENNYYIDFCTIIKQTTRRLARKPKYLGD